MSGNGTTYISYCCREWISPVGYEPGRCGLCGEKPTYLRDDDWTKGDERL